MIDDAITAGARTVTTAFVHLGELKQRALEMLASFSASRRGYFTPSEDENVRHLLVSYWQTRNALIEQVIAFHRGESQECFEREAGFLVAYAGALVLIDAARFLQEQLHDRPIVLAKLNEPESHFGIPPGTYDRVQKSLTSPVHAWHLYHALQYYQSHARELKSAAAAGRLESMTEIISELEPRLKATLRDYVLSRTRVRAREMLTALRQDVLSRAIYGLQKAVSSLMADIFVSPGHSPAIPPIIAQQLRKVLQPGDVIVTRKEHALTNYFLPGYFPHAALFLGQPAELDRLGLREHPNVSPRWRRLLELDTTEHARVLEAMKDGVLMRSITSPLRCDAFAILRPQLTQSQVATALSRGLFHEGKCYDFDFDFTRSDRLVCTEVVYRTYEGVGDLRFHLTRRAGRLTLSAADLVSMALQGRDFAVCAAFVPSMTERLVTGDSAIGVVRHLASQSAMRLN